MPQWQKQYINPEPKQEHMGGFKTSSFYNKPQNIQPHIWESSKEGKQIDENVIRREGIGIPQNQNIFDYTTSAIQGATNLIGNFPRIKKNECYR